MKSTIWYINHYAGGPGIGRHYRSFLMCKEWIKSGYNAMVIMSQFHHHLYQPIKKQNELIQGVPYLFLKTSRYKGNGLGRIFNMIQFTYRLIIDQRLINPIDKPSIIIVSSPQPFSVLGAFFLARKHKAKLIFEVRDLWPLSLIELLKMKKYHPLILIMNLVEKIAYQVSDHVVSLLPNAYEYMKRKGLSQDKFTWIPNGIIASDTGKTTKEPYALQKIRQIHSENKFIVLYAGAHGIPNHLLPLLEIASELENLFPNEFYFLLFGDGAEKKKLIRFANKKKIKNIEFYPGINKEDINQVFEQCDVGFISIAPLSLYNYGISMNKIIEYMLAGLPVFLMANIPDTIVKFSKAGISMNSFDILKAVQLLKHLKDLPPQERKKMGERGRKYVLKYLNNEILAKNYIEIFKKLGTSI